MKKFINSLLAICILLALNSCGGADAGFNAENVNSLKDEVIKRANEQYPLEETPLLGELPSLCNQGSRAIKSVLSETVGDYIKVKLSGGKEDFDTKNLSDREQLKYLEKFNELSDKIPYDETKEALAAYYTEKEEAMCATLVGKELPVEFEKDQFSAASVKIQGIDLQNYVVTLDISATLAQPIEYINKSGSCYLQTLGVKDGETMKLDVFGKQLRKGDFDNQAGYVFNYQLGLSPDVFKGLTTFKLLFTPGYTL